LNVEALALESVSCALTAANAHGSERATEVHAELVAANFDSVTHLRVGGRKPSMFAAMSGYFRCADGWLRTHANFPHHAAALGQALAVTDAARSLMLFVSSRWSRRRPPSAPRVVSPPGDVCGRSGNQARRVVPWQRSRGSGFAPVTGSLELTSTGFGCSTSPECSPARPSHGAGVNTCAEIRFRRDNGCSSTAAG
jgi:hypothetical protein